LKLKQKKTLISVNSQTQPPNLLALEKKTTPANIEVERRGEEKKSRIGFLMQMYKREIKYKSG
jgi:hypothetical protein